MKDLTKPYRELISWYDREVRLNIGQFKDFQISGDEMNARALEIMDQFKLDLEFYFMSLSWEDQIEFFLQCQHSFTIEHLLDDVQRSAVKVIK